MSEADRIRARIDAMVAEHGAADSAAERRKVKDEARRERAVEKGK